MLRDWWVEVMYYPVPKSIAGVRLMLWARYQHIGLTFTTEPDDGIGG
jgi:hypothetical protein